MGCGGYKQRTALDNKLVYVSTHTTPTHNNVASTYTQCGWAPIEPTHHTHRHRPPSSQSTGKPDLVVKASVGLHRLSLSRHVAVSLSLANKTNKYMVYVHLGEFHRSAQLGRNFVNRHYTHLIIQGVTHPTWATAHQLILPAHRPESQTTVFVAITGQCSTPCVSPSSPLSTVQQIVQDVTIQHRHAMTRSVRHTERYAQRLKASACPLNSQPLRRVGAYFALLVELFAVYR